MTKLGEVTAPQVQVMLHPETIKEVKLLHSEIQTIEQIDTLGQDFTNVLILNFLEKLATSEIKAEVSSSDESTETSLPAREKLLEEFKEALPSFKKHKSLFPYGGQSGKDFLIKYPQLKQPLLNFVQSIETADFYIYLMQSQRTVATAERTLTLMGDWSLEETSIMEQTTTLIDPVTVYGNGPRERSRYKKHSKPFQGSILSVNGHLFANKYGNLTPAWGHMVTEVQRDIKGTKYSFYDLSRFDELYIRKFLPADMKLDKLHSENRILKSMVGVGAGYFLGPFHKDYVKAKLKDFTVNYITRYGQQLFPNTDTALDLYDDEKIDIEKIGKKNYLVYAPLLGVGISPLAHPQAYDDDFASSVNPWKPATFKNHYKVKVMAGDHFSRGAEFIPAAKTEIITREASNLSINRDCFFASDEPATWRDCSYATPIFDEPGDYYYNGQWGAYLPRAYNSWLDFVLDNNFVFKLQKEQIFTIDEKQTQVLSAQKTIEYFNKVELTEKDKQTIRKKFAWIRARNLTHRTVQLYLYLDTILEIYSIPKPNDPRPLAASWIEQFCNKQQEQKSTKASLLIPGLNNLDIWTWVNQGLVKLDIAQAIELVEEIRRVIYVKNYKPKSQEKLSESKFSKEFTQEFKEVFQPIQLVCQNTTLSLEELRRQIQLFKELHYFINSIRDFYEKAPAVKSGELQSPIIVLLRKYLVEYINQNLKKSSDTDKEQKIASADAKIQELRQQIDLINPPNKEKEYKARPYYSLYRPTPIEATILINDQGQIETQFDQLTFSEFVKAVPIFSQQIPKQYQNGSSSLLPGGMVAIADEQKYTVKISSYLTKLGERGVNVIQPKHLNALMSFFIFFQMKEPFVICYDNGDTQHTYLFGLVSVYWVLQDNYKNATFYLRNMSEPGSFIQYTGGKILVGNKKDQTSIPVDQVVVKRIFKTEAKIAELHYQKKHQVPEKPSAPCSTAPDLALFPPSNSSSASMSSSSGSSESSSTSPSTFTRCP
ncbi:MAG: hypothetical protein JSR33_01900 [Proteobacteria bacterium]|nr:hypothetical protein [Pseudomonadota bacterium]